MAGLLGTSEARTPELQGEFGEAARRGNLRRARVCYARYGGAADALREASAFFRGYALALLCLPWPALSAALAEFGETAPPLPVQSQSHPPLTAIQAKAGSTPRQWETIAQPACGQLGWGREVLPLLPTGED